MLISINEHGGTQNDKPIERGEMQYRRENQTNESNSVDTAIANVPEMSKCKEKTGEQVSPNLGQGAAIEEGNGSILICFPGDCMDFSSEEHG